MAYMKVERNIEGSPEITQDGKSADAVLILGAAQYNGVASPALRSRTISGAETFKKINAKYIITSGGVGEGDTQSEAEVSAQLLREYGINESQIVVENTAKTTYESMAAVKAIIEKNKINSIVIVSDGYHLASSKAMAETIWPSEVKVYTAPSTDPGYSPESLSYQKIRETVRIGLAQVAGYRRISHNAVWFTSRVKSKIDAVNASR